MEVMEGSGLNIRIIIIVTILLAGVLFLAVKLIARAKNKAGGRQSDVSLSGFQFDTSTDKQNYERKKLICPVLLKKPQGIMKTSLKELTPNGAFLTCPNPLPIGEMFPVKILIENQKPLKFDAEVLWNNNNISTDKIIHRGMKVRFLQLSNDDRKTLNEIISTPSRENLFT
jgi:hypothetical protein